MRQTFATFSRNTTTSDTEGNPQTSSSIVWRGRGLIKLDESEVVEGSTGKSHSLQKIHFTVRKTASVQRGDYGELLDASWYVSSVEITPNCKILHLESPASIPYR